MEHSLVWRRRETVAPDINVTPLVDVVLVLLIIFMVVAPQLDQDVPVDLPGIFNVDPEVEGNVNPFKVSVAQAGQYYVDEREFDLDGAVKYLVEQHALEPDRRLLLRADSKLKYGEVRAFMSRVQQAGFPGMNFMVGEKHRVGAVRATAEYGGEQEALAAQGDAVPADAAPVDAPFESAPAEPLPADAAPPDASGS